MNSLCGMFTKFRPVIMSFFAIQTPLTGCGFALAFGWLWFPALRDILLAGLFANSSIFPSTAFSFAFGAGCLLYGPFCGRMENGDTRQIRLNAALAHGIPSLLLGLLLLTRGIGLSFTMLDGALAGLAGALPGVWWTSRLLALGPGRAVAALAWAAFVALALSLPLSWIHTDSTGVVCSLIASFALAWLTMLSMARHDRDYDEGKDVRPDTTAPLDVPYSFGPFRGIYAVLLCGVGPIFFCLGSLNVLVHGRNEIPHPVEQICAFTVAVFMLGGPLERTLGISACILAVLAFCLSYSTELAPLLFPVGAGLLEAASVALCAAALRRDTFGRGTVAPVAGLYLILILVAVQGGVLVGWQFKSFSDNVWPVLPGLVALLLAAAAHKGNKLVAEISAVQEAPDQEDLDQEEMELEPSIPFTVSTTATPTTAATNPSIAEQLTKREHAVASLLVNDFSNKDAAENLGLSENTLRWHIKKINKKTETSSIEELVAFLRRTGQFPDKKEHPRRYQKTKRA